MLLFGWTSLSPLSLLSTPLSSAHPQTMLWTRCSTIVFLQDHDFQELHKTPLAEQVVSTLRIRRGPSKGGAQQTAKKHAARVESTTSVWMSQA